MQPAERPQTTPDLTGHAVTRNLGVGVTFQRGRWLFLFLMAIGSLTFAAGVLYFLRFVNIPYQDPPPWLEERYGRDSDVASVLMSLGGCLFLSGALSLAVARLTRKWRTRGGHRT